MTPTVERRAMRTLTAVLFVVLAMPISAYSQTKTDPNKAKHPAATKKAGEQAQPARTKAATGEGSKAPLTTYPATQEAQSRLSKLQEMRAAAQANNGDKHDPPNAKPGLGRRHPGQDSESRARRLEEARRRAIESARGGADKSDRIKGEPGDESSEAANAEAADEKELREIAPPYGATEWKPSGTSPRPKTPVTPARAELKQDEPEEVAEAAGEAGNEEVEEPKVVVTPIEEGGRDYFISFEETPWEDVIAHYVKLVGKPLMGEDMMPIGELTYVSKRRFTRDEMLDELNFLLLEQNVFVVEREDYIYLVPLSELSKFMKLDHVFTSIEAFEAADLRDLEICETLIQIKDRQAEDIRDMLSPSMPDHALPVVAGDSNKIKITGLAQDVRRFMDMLAMADAEKYDPRQTRFIKVETNVTEVERMLREILGAEKPTRRYDREQRKFVTEGGDSKVLIIADERTKNLIVKATPEEIKDIEDIVKLIDEKPDIGEFKTIVMPVKYGSATEIARLLNEILQQEQGNQRRTQPVRTTRSSSRNRRGRTPQRTTRQTNQTAAPEDIIVEDLYERAKKTVRIVADDRTNNLLVYATEDGAKRVREILQQIDVPIPTNFKTVELQYADAEQIHPTIEQIVSSMTNPGGRGRSGATIIADAKQNVLHIIADREEIVRIEQIIKEFDVEAPEDEWHFVEMVNITPSDGARIIAPFLSDGAASARRPSRRGRTPARATATSQTIPLDEANMLIVICSQEEWEDVDRVLKIADEQAISSKPELRFFDVVNGNPESIAETVTQLYANYTHPVLGRSRAFVDTMGKQIVVQAVVPALEEIESLIKSLDITVEEDPLVILPLEHADVSQVLQLVQPLLSDGAARGRGRYGRGGGSGGQSIQADTMTNSLIIQADENTLTRIKDYVARYEAQVAAQTPERKSYVLKYATPRDVMNAINSFFGSRSRGRQPTAARVSAVTVGNQVIVHAPAQKQQEVAALISELDAMSDMGVTTLLIKMPGADIRSIAGRLTNAFRDRVRTQGAVARFEPDLSTETILMTCSKDVLEEAEDLLDQYRELAGELIWETEAYQLKHAGADETSRWLREQLMSLMSQSMSQQVVRQFRVSADMRTNRVFINAPQLAVKQGLLLLDSYDKPVEQQVEQPMEIWTEKLPGLDVRNLASQLQRNLNELMRGRTDRLRATVTADQMTNNLIITAPTDMKKKVAELVAQFASETEDLTLEQHFIDVLNADANYVANQLRNILNVRIGNQRGRGVAQQVNIQVDTRLNRVILNAPKSVIEEALALAAQLDQEATEERPLQTIPLVNADAGTVNNILRQVYNEKIRAKTLQVSVEPLTNSLIVSASKEDFADIAEWVKELDDSAKQAVTEPEILEFKNANPWEVYNVLNATFMQKSRGRTVVPGKEVKMSIIAGRCIVVQAPPDKMAEIKALAAKLDEVGQNKATVQVYELPGMGNRINDFARQLQQAMHQQATGREMRPTITAYPPADALIVTAWPEQFEQIEQMMEQFKPLMEVKASKSKFYHMEYVDAPSIVGMVTDLVRTKLIQGKGRSSAAQDFSVKADARTNRLIVFAPENIMADVDTIVKELDIDMPDDDVFIMELQYADPWETRNMINDVFGYRGSKRGQSQSETVYVTVNNAKLIIKAPPKKLEQIQALVAEIDKEDLTGMQVKTYQLKVLNAQMVSGQVQAFLRSMGSVQSRGQMQPGAFAEPTTNTLVVIAPKDKLPFIEGLITQIEALGPGTASTIESYVLKNARADQVSRHVDQMLKAKVAEREGDVRGRKTQQRTAVTADPETNRLFVFAPQEYQELAAEMIQMIDQEIDTGEIVHIIKLENADASSLAQTVTQTMQGGGSRGRGSAPLKVKVVPDAGSNSILLSGLPRDVAEVEQLINDLEVTYDTIPELQYFTLEYALAYDVADTIRTLFPAGRNPADDVNVTEDEYYNKLLVTANRRKMRQVEAVIKRMDVAPEYDDSLFGAGKEIYFIEIYKGDAFEIAWDVQDLLPPEDRGGPQIEADWFGEYIQVICRPDEYSRIERLIRQFEKKAKPEIVVRARQFLGDADQLRQYLQERQIDFDEEQFDKPKTQESIIIDLHPEEGEQADSGRRKAPATSWLDKADPRKLVNAAPSHLGGFVLTALFPDANAEDAGEDDEQQSKPVAAERESGARDLSKAPIEADYVDDLKSPPEKQRATIQVMPDGRIIMRGPRDAVDELEDAIDLFEEDLSRGEVIRIFRFRHGDVNAASRILDMMFNTRQVRMPQRQTAQQRGQGRNGGRDGGRDGGEEDSRQNAMQQALQMMGGGRNQQGGASGGQQIRIATDASHNYIIVKCDEVMLPDIIQLLRELDIPPAEVDIEVIQMKNLDATETANNIKEVLGLGGRSSGRQSQQLQSLGRGGRSNSQQQLMEMIQQQMVSVGGDVSAKVESVTIVPNNITNSLLVSAPKEVMKIVKNVIDELEGLEGGDVTVIRRCKLDHAKLDDILPLLQELFGAASGSGGRGGPRGGSSPADLGPVTISGDPRNNTVIFVAQAKDVDVVEAQIKELDFLGAISEVEMYVCVYGDATGIAAVVQEMFGNSTGGGGGRGARRGGAASGSSNLEVRITAEPATNTILVFAPEDKRALILEHVRKLDYQNQQDIRQIVVTHAKPDQLADKLIQIFGGAGGSAASSSGRGGRRNARQQAVQTTGRLVIIPDENSSKLLVRAPDEVYEQMLEVVALLDQPSENLQIRTFELKHADAATVVDSVKAALMEFMQLKNTLGEEGLGIDAFSAMPDTRTNSVIVVGSDETFLFVEQVINAIDGDVSADREKQFRIFVLDRADAQIVADAINSFAAGGGATPSRSGGRRGRGGFTPSMGGGGSILDVQAIADTTVNAVMVYGRIEDINKVEQTVISELEGALVAHRQFATIKVEQAVPSQLITYIQPFLDETAGMRESGGGSRRGGGIDAAQGPRLIGNDNNGTIVVYGSERQIEEVQSLVARFDNEDIAVNQFEIIPVPWGQDAFTLASTVQDLVNSSEQEIADRTGRMPRLVTVSADEHSNAIIAFGEPSQTAMVKTVVAQLQDIRPEKPVTRVIELINLSSAEAEQLIEDLQQRRSSSGSSSRGSYRSSPNRRSTPSRSSTPRRRSSSGSRRRSWNWETPAENAPRLTSAPWRWSSREAAEMRKLEAVAAEDVGAPRASFASPFVGMTAMMPQLTTTLILQVATETAKQQPAPEQSMTPREAKQQQMLSSVSGQLRGDVVATPLDSRRIIITGDENDVDFIVQMLMMMESSTPQAVIEVFQLENAKAATVAPALEETMNKLLEARGGGSDRVDQFSIVAEARGNALIIAASETNMDLIAELIEKLDIATEETQAKLIPLLHIRAAEAAELIEQALEKLAAIRELPNEAKPSIQAVERSNAIQIVGTPADIAEIERMIQGIDVELPPEDDFSTALVTIIDLKNAKAEDLAETLTELIEMERTGRGQQSDTPLLRKLIMKTAAGIELPPLDLDKPIAIFSEKGKNSLIIFSNEKNSEALMEIVGLFDSLPIGAEVEVKSFVLEHANAEQVADLLQEMFDDSKKALKRPSEGDSSGMESGVMPPVPPGLAGRGLPYNVVVTHDERSNTVFVIGREDAVMLAAGVVNELDKPSVDLSLKPYVIQLRNMQASQLQEHLEELLDERLDAIGGDQNQARDGAVIRADDRSNSLVVFASETMITMIEDLALQLDQADAYSVVDSEFRRLRYADAAKLAGLIQELFDKKKDAVGDVSEGSQEDVLFVFADARSNALMMTGTRDYLLEANELIDNLDQAFDPTVQFKVRAVRLNSAANIAQLLQDMVEESRGDIDSEMKGTPIHIAADPYSNNLLLAASAEDMLMIERWVDVLDRPSEPGRITRIIPLRRGKAQDMAQSAQDLFEAQASGADQDLTVTHDETTNSVIAIGPPGVVADIEDFVKEYNEVEGAEAIVRMFALQQADAEDAGELIRSILEGKGGSVGGGSSSTSTTDDFNQVMLIFQREHPEIGLETLKALRKEIVVIDDLRTNSLVVTAPPESMPLMEALVEAVDVPPAAANIRIFKLRNSDAEEIVTMLEELFETDGATGGGGDEDQEFALAMGGMVAGGRQHLAFTTDMRTNSVIAAGTPGYLDMVDELILRLDSEPIQERKTIVYEPSNNPAVAIQQAISEYSDAETQRLNELQDEISVSKRQEREITAIASEDTNRIILDYDPRREAEVLDIVHNLDQPPPQVMIQVLIVEVTMDNSLELGVEFAFQDLQYTKAGTTDTTTFDFVGGTDIGAAGTGLGGFTFTITGADFNFLVRTLQNEGSLNILSRPQIVAMDNQEARIEIINDVPYAAGTTTGVGGVVSTNVQRKDVGIKLVVTPHINPDGFVRMEIVQEVSDITGSTVEVGQGLTSPIFFKREAETVVTVKDSETVVLGGLIETSDEEREQKIPILGDMPVIGPLFSNRNHESSRTELLVVLTPRIIRSAEDFREISIQERDRTGRLPEAVLTSELMDNLRVRAEELQPKTKRETIGPFPKRKAKAPAPVEVSEVEEQDVEESYGPTPDYEVDEPDPAQYGAEEDSFDVPLSMAGGGGSHWNN